MNSSYSDSAPENGMNVSFICGAEGITATVIAIGAAALLVCGVGYIIYKKFKRLNYTEMGTTM